MKKLQKKEVPLQQILKEKENFVWQDIDLATDPNKKAFVDKIVERAELNKMDLVLPEPYKTTVEHETHKQTMHVKIKGLIQDLKSNYRSKYNEQLSDLDR